MWLLALVAGTALAADGGVVIHLGGAVAPAASAGASPVVVPGAAPISLDLEEADIHGVIRLFSEVSGLNFVVGDEVQCKVTVRLTLVPWDQALGAVLAANGLMAVWMGDGIVTVQPISTGR